MSRLVIEVQCWRDLTDAEKQAKQDVAGILEADRARLLARQPFLASLAMRMEVIAVVDGRLPTAGTDGQHLFFNALFMQSLDSDERLFVMGHEIWHCAAMHFRRRGDREPGRWNVAIDHEANSLLVEQGFRMPEDAILYDSWRKLNAETVYELLEADTDTDRGKLADTHDVQAAELSVQFDDPVPFDPDFQPRSLKRVWDSWPMRVHAAAQQFQGSDRGDEPGWLSRVLQINGKPAVPWQSVLRRFVDRIRDGRYQWIPPNRRYLGQGIILPGRAGERLRVAVAIDSSGSTATDLAGFIAELNGILRSYSRFEVRLLVCDTCVRSDETWTDNRPIPKDFKVVGGGGTDLRTVFDKLRTNPPVALVFLTDGESLMPSKAPPYPVLWCLTPTGRKPAWGTAVRLPRGKNDE